MSARAAWLPGLLAAVVVMLVGFTLADALGRALLAARGLSGASPISGVPVAIVLGLLLRNLLPLPASLGTGLKFCTTTVLRLGIVLVGIKLSVLEMARLGAAGVPVVLTAIVTGLVFVTWFNRRLGLPPRLGTLIAAGTSICGVTAIVSTAPLGRTAHQMPNGSATREASSSAVPESKSEAGKRSSTNSMTGVFN